MRIIIYILCCVCGIYGKNNTTVSVQKRNTINVTFNVSINVNQNYASCITPKKEFILEEGRTVKLNAYRINIPKALIGNNNNNNKNITDVEKVKCTYKNGSRQHKLGNEYAKEGNNGPWEEELTITKDLYGVWSCKLYYNKKTVFGDISQTELVGADLYSYVNCDITVKKPELPTTPLPPVSGKETLNSQIWYIIGGVGILVLLIIVGQTIALCYFRRKAQPRRRMDSMTARSRLDRGDRARYSAPPCKKRKSSAVAEVDRDSHIYEMVGVNALYNKSSDLGPRGNTDTAEKDIRGRPPLPLPHEIPKPVPVETLPRNKPSPMTSTPSTLSLNSTNSGSHLINKKGKELPPPPGKGFKKAPARPPKQIDELSIPGSLRRTAKPTASPAAGSALAKTGALPKATATESPMSELKNIFKKRNVGKDTPTPPAAATLERKEPPKVEVKTSTLTKTQTQKQPPNVSAKPIVNQQNQIKLILPKIEASLKAPKPLVPNPIEPTASPVKSPPPPKKVKKPSQVVSQKQKPVSQKPVTQPAPKLPKRPLPTPESARKLPPEPISPISEPSLPPIYQTADEDSPGTDDEEWTYEQLGQYNIYNI